MLSPNSPCNSNDVSCDDDAVMAALTHADFTLPQLQEWIEEGKTFLDDLARNAVIDPARGLMLPEKPDWAEKLVRRQGIAAGVIEKVGSTRLAKRRPDDTAPFLAHVQARADAGAPLVFRSAFGPLKNANRCGCRQDPDWAEYLAFVQKARFIQAIAAIYPYGVKMEVVPDDLRGRAANNCPENYTAQYIAGLQGLADRMGLTHFITVENGEARLYAHYDVPAFRDAAEEALKKWQTENPEAFAARFDAALHNAAKNLNCVESCTADDIETSAWKYLVAHRAEILSGMWSPIDAFPLVYANHPGNYQLYTMGYKKTKLPWQIELPVSLINRAAA